jgi:hypothetical protein
MRHRASTNTKNTKLPHTRNAGIPCDRRCDPPCRPRLDLTGPMPNQIDCAGPKATSDTASHQGVRNNTSIKHALVLGNFETQLKGYNRNCAKELARYPANTPKHEYSQRSTHTHTSACTCMKQSTRPMLGPNVHMKQQKRVRYPPP